MNNKKSYVIIPNAAFGFGTEYHLNKDEMIVFAHLQMMKQVGLENTTITMVDMLVAGLGWETPAKPSRSKKRVSDALEGLESKGYIVITFKGKISKDVLTITMTKAYEKDFEVSTSVEWRGSPFIFKGFTRVEYDKYNLAENNGYYFIAIAYTLWRQNATYTYQIANKEWELVLGVTDKTAREILVGCASFITKTSGAGYANEQGQYQQEPNTYELKKEVSTGSKLEKVQQEVTNMTYLEKFASTVTDPRYMSDMEVIKELYDKDTRLDRKGYEAYKETTCPNLKKAGDDLFAILEKKGQTWLKEKLEKEYQDRKKRQREIQIYMTKMLETIPNELKEGWTSSYKKKEKEDDSFFDDIN